jgi:hypothetical protein
MTTDVPPVGTLIETRQQMDALPIGSVLQERNGARFYIRALDGTWNQWTETTFDQTTTYGIPATGPWNSDAFSMGYNRVYKIGASDLKVVPETLAQYQWRFRNNAISGAVENSIGMRHVTDALHRLGLTDEQFPLGPKVPITLNDEVPDGTVVYVGSPDEPRTLGVFRRDRGAWQWVFGHVDYTPNTMMVESMPGVETPPDWWTAPGEDNEEERIKKFKARAYQVGRRTQQAASWCGTYDNVMARVGVTAEAVRGIDATQIGDVIPQGEVTRLPEGAILAWVDPENTTRWAVYRRDNNAQNTTRTERILGNRAEGGPLNNWRAGARVVFLPDLSDRWEWQLRTNRAGHVLSTGPVGLFFLYSGSIYVKARDGRIAPAPDLAVADRGRWTIEQSFNQVAIVVIGWKEQS